MYHEFYQLLQADNLQLEKKNIGQPLCTLKKFQPTVLCSSLCFHTILRCRAQLSRLSLSLFDCVFFKMLDVFRSYQKSFDIKNQAIIKAEEEKCDIIHIRKVASTNARYQLKNQLFVKRSQYIRTENPLHKQSEKAYMCF